MNSRDLYFKYKKELSDPTTLKQLQSIWQKIKSNLNELSDKHVNILSNFYKEFKKDLTESLQLNEMVGKEYIYDDQINRCINEVINDINTKTNYDINNNIEWMFGETSHAFGVTCWPKTASSKYTITLNKQMCGEDDNAIKNVIAHELCHYIHMEEQFERKIVYWFNSHTLKYNQDMIRKLDKGQYSSHGSKWKLIADRVSKALQLNPPITRTNTFELHNKVGDYVKSKQKYQVVCTQCGQTWNFQKATDFVKKPNAYYELDGKKHYLNWCPRCKKGGIFKTNYNEVK